MVRRLLLLAFIAATLAAGCNSVFGIHEGTPRPICADDMTIDDMEDGDGLICRRFAGRTGGWFDFGDGSPTGELTPSSNGPFTPTRIKDGSRDTSRYAARFSGSGFTIFGAIMGFELLSPKQTFDASGLGGVTFSMRSNTPVAIDFPTEETVPSREGGQCETGCNDHFSFQITAPAPGWFKYDVPFNALRGGGGSATWNPRHLYGVNFRVPKGAAFDVWVDDVAFYSCAGPECEPTCTDQRFSVSCRAMGGSLSSCQPPGTDCTAVENWCAGSLLLDDMEDSDAAICPSDGRHGWWYVAGDGTSTDLTPKEGMDFVQTAIPGCRGTSHYAARLTGSGFTDVGAVMGLSLSDGQPQPYDASTVSGIKFWMRNSVPTMVLLLPVETVPLADGGQCVDRAGEYNCYNNFSFKITAPSNDWVLYELPFSAFSQTEGSVTWNPAHLLNIGFAPRRDTPFDVWVDDVQFYDCSASPCLPTCADLAFPVPCAANAQSPAGCRRSGTDCATFVLGCGASNTTRAPADGLIATFNDAGGATEIARTVLAVGDPSPTYTTDGALHVTLNAPTRSTGQAPLVVHRFQDCVDAAAFTGVQFSISGALSGCTLHYFTEDSVHLYDDGGPMSHAHHGIGRAGALTPFAALTAGQITSVPQTLKVPFAAQAGGIPARPINPAKLTGLGWEFSAAPFTGGGTTSCVADLTIDDVSFY